MVFDKRPAPLPLAMKRSPSSESDTSTSTAPSLKSPRTPRFAEATTVYSPIENTRSPFADPLPAPKTQSFMAQSQPSDIGFGYISNNEASNHVTMPLSPASPLKSALKVPGTPGRRIDNPLSPTFREEQLLEKHELETEKEQARDLKIKTRVRLAKVCLRGVNFSCSLIVLAMLSTTMHIFFATKTLPSRNNLPAWASGTKTWPQMVVLAISCTSLAFCLLIFYGYWRGGHKRAEKTAVYYTIFAVGFFVFSIVMWGLAAGILQGTKNNSGNQDVWGWSCVDNKRRQLFSQDVDYALVCRLQSWSLICCVIEVVVETITIIIYGIVFYRYYSKRRLRKSMSVRDRARSDLYLAQLRSQSAPNTPGFGPLSPSFSTYSNVGIKSPRFPPAAYNGNGLSYAEEGKAGFMDPGTRFVDAKSSSTVTSKPFTLQPPPIKIHAATPKTSQNGFSPINRTTSPPAPRAYSPPAERVQEAAPIAPGEQVYGAVPIPGAYQPASPPPQQMGFNLGSVGQAVTSEHRIESPPGSPRIPRAGSR